MSIIVNLDIMMAHQKISLGELAEKVDITPANLPFLKPVKIDHSFFYFRGNM